MSERDFVTLKKLGEGSFGEVYKVKRISDMS
jgi:serine/threonine protein kinase